MGVAGVMLIVVDPAGEVVGAAGVLRLDSERRLEAAVRLYRSYGVKDIPDYNKRNPRAEIWMEFRLTPGRS
jgi:hypothetical protein